MVHYDEYIVCIIMASLSNVIFREINCSLQVNGNFRAIRPELQSRHIYNKRSLSLTAPLSNNTLSMIYSPMNTK